MAIMILGEIGARQATARGVMRRTLARMIAAREHQARRTVKAYLLGLDDATLATYGIDRRTIGTDRGFPF